jgi:hypothetical protein
MNPRRWLLACVLAGLIVFGWEVLLPARPARSQLLAAAEGADRVMVRSCPGGKVVFEVRGREEARDLLRQIDWERGGVRCPCGGQYLLELRSGGRLLVSLGYHHGELLRWRNGPWKTDVRLTESSRRRLAAWFAARGFPKLGE